MTKSVIPQDPSKSNRVDPPHDLLAATADTSPEAFADPWMAYAGRDPEFTSEQVDRQAGELLSYVQDQNKEIDERQAELNAKLAQLDSQLRNARLRAADDLGTDLLADTNLIQAANPFVNGSEAVKSAANNQSSVSNSAAEAYYEREQRRASPSGLALGDLGYAQEEVSVRVSRAPSQDLNRDPNRDPNRDLSRTTQQEFDEVDRIVAQFSDSALDEPAGIEDLWNHDPDEIAMDHEIPAVAETASDVEDRLPKAAVMEEISAKLPPANNSSSASIESVGERLDAFPSMLAGSHLRRVDSLSGDADALASERRLLAEQKLDLDRQKSVVGQLQQEAQSLHREALEMRIVTEQLWGKLSESTPPEKLKELLASLRKRLEAHYAKEQEALACRKNEIQSLQNVIEEKQAALRDQSAQMQGWFATREEQLRSYANEIDARCSLLDRREQRLQDEFAKWEAQRKDYETQLQGLAQKLKLNGISL